MTLISSFTGRRTNCAKNEGHLTTLAMRLPRRPAGRGTPRLDADGGLRIAAHEHSSTNEMLRGVLSRGRRDETLRPSSQQGHTFTLGVVRTLLNIVRLSTYRVGKDKLTVQLEIVADKQHVILSPGPGRLAQAEAVGAEQEVDFPFVEVRQESFDS